MTAEWWQGQTAKDREDKHPKGKIRRGRINVVRQKIVQAMDRIMIWILLISKIFIKALLVMSGAFDIF